MSKGARWAVAIAALLWMAFVYASFYLVQQQRPLGAANLRAIGSLLGDLAAAGATLFVAASAGHHVCRRLGIGRRSGVAHGDPVETLILATGVGAGIVAFGVLGLGLIGWLEWWAIAGWLALLIALSLPDAATVARTLWGIGQWPRPGRALWVYLVAMGLITTILALTPPLGWDSLFYHLTLPRAYLAQGRIAPITDMPHQYFPGLMEMLYLGAMGLKGDTAAKLLHLAFLPLSSGTVYLVAKRHLCERCGWPAVAAYASMPMVFLLGSWAYNDLALAYYQVAALYAYLNWREGKAGRWMALAGILSGLAMGLKYTAFLCPVSIAAFVLWTRVRGRASAGLVLGDLSTYGLVAAAVAAPWYARNLAFTGNPVYPFLYGLFGGREWDAWRAAWYARAGSGLGWDLMELVKLPWTATLGIRDMNFYDGRAGPLFLLALPALVVWIAGSRRSKQPRPASMGYALAFAGLQYVAWAYGVVQSRSLLQSRLLLPSLAVLCAPMAYVYRQLSGLDLRAFSLRRVVGMSVALVLAANLCYQVLYMVRTRPLAVLVGAETREAFLERNLGAHYAAMELIGERVPEDGKVLFLWEPRSYYCERRAEPDPILERWAWWHHKHGDIGEVARALAAEGYTHVLLHRAGLELVVGTQLDPLGAADQEALAEFGAQYLELVGTADTTYELYTLKRDGL